MSKVLQDYYPRNVSQYVPLMEFAADVVDGIHKVSLGAPSTADPNGILVTAAAGATAATYTSADWATTFDGSATHVGETVAGSINGRYGRALTMVGTAGSDHVITVTGRDYLGQIMSEAFTLSGTSTIYGAKAFKFVDTVSIAAGGQAGDTFDLGWSDVLGLPYRATELIAWKEDNVQIPVGRRVQTNGQIWTTNSDVSLFGSMATNNGFVVGQSYVATVANTTLASVLTAEIGGTAVAGLSTSLATDEAIGDASTDFVVTDDHGTTGRIAAGGAIESVSDGGGTAGIGHITYYIDEGVRFIDGDATTATTTTGDTRGTVRPYTLCDGSIVFEVEYACLTNNLHGVAQA